MGWVGGGLRWEVEENKIQYTSNSESNFFLRCIKKVLKLKNDCNLRVYEKERERERMGRNNLLRGTNFFPLTFPSTLFPLSELHGAS